MTKITTLFELLDLQAAAMADDVPIDLARMSAWTSEQATTFFETGGTMPAQEGPVRVLCLHGGGGNRKVNTMQMARLKVALGSDATFDYIEGTRRDWSYSEGSTMTIVRHDCTLRHALVKPPCHMHCTHWKVRAPPLRMASIRS